MEKTNDKSMLISELIKDLERWKENLGDMEIFIMNEEEMCFDGVGKTFHITTPNGNEKAIALLRNKVVLKI